MNVDDVFYPKVPKAKGIKAPTLNFEKKLKVVKGMESDEEPAKSNSDYDLAAFVSQLNSMFSNESEIEFSQVFNFEYPETFLNMLFFGMNDSVSSFVDSSEFNSLMEACRPFANMNCFSINSLDSQLVEKILTKHEGENQTVFYS